MGIAVGNRKGNLVGPRHKYCLILSIAIDAYTSTNVNTLTFC